jgi:integrase
MTTHSASWSPNRQWPSSSWTDDRHIWGVVDTPLHAATISRAFKVALRQAGLRDSRFHDLRHATATLLLSSGMGLEDVKNQLGHSSITLTSNTYGHVLEARQREVARVMDTVLGG